jgi:hypothetical protein
LYPRNLVVGRFETESKYALSRKDIAKPWSLSAEVAHSNPYTCDQCDWEEYVWARLTA